MSKRAWLGIISCMKSADVWSICPVVSKAAEQVGLLVGSKVNRDLTNRMFEGDWLDFLNNKDIRISKAHTMTNGNFNCNFDIVGVQDSHVER